MKDFCPDLFAEQAPYSCKTTTLSYPTLLEAASVAYTTAGLISSVLIPVTAFIAGKMGKMSEKKVKKVAPMLMVVPSNEL